MEIRYISVFLPSIIKNNNNLLVCIMFLLLWKVEVIFV